MSDVGYFLSINYNNCQRNVVPWVETLPGNNEIVQVLRSLKKKPHTIKYNGDVKEFLGTLDVPPTITVSYV